jgi:hypothetical protein
MLLLETSLLSAKNVMAFTTRNVINRTLATLKSTILDLSFSVPIVVSQ